MDQATLLTRRDEMRVQVIADWAASGVQCRLIAARWARELTAPQSARDDDQEDGPPAESTMRIAERMGVHNSTAARARMLLMGAGFLCQRPDRHYYYVP